MAKPETLLIAGFHDEAVPHTFFRQEQPTCHLAILYPGLGYNASMPLLYYPAQLLMARGADVLRVETTYSRRPDFLALSEAGQELWLKADALAACQVGLAQARYERVTLVGKSIGTLAMGYVLAAWPDLPGLECIWLTPLLRNRTLRERFHQVRQRALLIIGAADSHYRPELLTEALAATGGESLVIPGADHSLELRGDLPGSLRELQKIIAAIDSFLER